MIKGKFFRISLGPLINKTRGVPFLEEYKDLLHNYIYVTDHYEMYEKYKDSLTVIDIEKYRADHAWSKNKEILFSEKDPEKFVEGWKKFTCENPGYPYPLDLVRFGFLEGIKQGFTKLSYTGTNFFITKDQEKIDHHFDSIPSGIFTTPIYNENADWFVYDYIKEEIHNAYPDLKITGKYLYFDGFYFTLSFNSKEDAMLFYAIWDKVLEIVYHGNNKNILKTDAGYNQYEATIGFVMRIFCDNFGYKNDFLHHYWDPNCFGRNVCMVQDTFMYHYGPETRLFNHYGFYKNSDTKTVADFIRLNREGLEKYYSTTYHNINYEITEDNIIIKFKECE